MIIQIEFWQLASAIGGLLLAFFGFVFGFGRVLLNQIEKRLNDRFSAVEAAADEWHRLEKEFLSWRADLPLNYVRREDYIRNQTVLEAKFDALATKIEHWQLREAKS